jgi:hypothetical protein
MAELLDKETGSFIASIKDPVVRQRYQAQIADWAADQRVRFEGYERGQTAKLGVTNLKTGFELIANRLSRNASVQEFDEAIKDIRKGLAEMKGLPADVVAELEREGVAQASYSWLAGKPANEAKSALASGLFDKMLPPAAIERLNSNADVEIRRAQVELEAQQRAKVAETREQINLVIKQLTDGAVIPDDQLKSLIDTATTLGLNNQGYDLTKLGITNDVNRTYRAAAPAQIDAELKQVQAQIAAKGDSVPFNLTVRRDALQTLLTARTSEAKTDPLAVAAQNGIASGPIDWDNPATIAQRKTAALAAAKMLGVPPRFLGDEEAAQLKVTMTTPQGRASAAAQAAKFEEYAGAVAAQIAPNDLVFRASVGLGAPARQLVYEGEAVLDSGKVKIDMVEARRVWSERAAAATSQLGQTATGATFEMAVAIYAQSMARRGVSEFEEEKFRSAMNTALGATRENGVLRGGLGDWNGRRVVLPTSMTQSEFERRMSAIVRPNAFYKNGSRVTGQQLRDGFTPQMLAPNIYGFVNARGEFLLKENTQDIYRLDLTKITPPTQPTTKRKPTAPVTGGRFSMPSQ